MKVAESPAVRLLSQKPRIFWGRIIWVLIQRGWTPPRPSDQSMHRILDDMDSGKFRNTGASEARLDLSPTERQVLAMIAQGMSYQEIGDELGMGKYTVKDRAVKAYRRLGAKNAAHAVWLALKRGIIE